MSLRTRSASMPRGRSGGILGLLPFLTPAAIPYAALDDADWQSVERRSCCYVAGQLIPAPIHTSQTRAVE